LFSTSAQVLLSAGATRSELRRMFERNGYDAAAGSALTVVNYQ
jgi:hypothetical protein